MDDIAAALERRLAEVGTPERAEQEKRYLKSELTFLGATVWQIDRVVKEDLTARALSHDEAVELAIALWSVPIFERRMAAVAVLERSPKVLGTGDLALIERLLRESRTWALVDNLAVAVVGRIVEADERGSAPILDRWAVDSDFWIRRASLLGELCLLRRGAPLDRFVARADPMLEEREFFIRKSIGWVLREAGKRRPDDVVAWLAPRTHRASGVTMREAVKYLPEGDRDRLMAAYREKRPAA